MQLDLEIDRLNRRTEVVEILAEVGGIVAPNPEGRHNIEVVGVEAEINKEVATRIDPDVILDMDFDEEDPEEEAEEFYEAKPEGGYVADMEVEVAGGKEIMSQSDSDIMMWEEGPPKPEEIMSESDSEIMIYGYFV